MYEGKRSNRDRAVLREQCRDGLSRHLSERLGLSIRPQDVRLVPGPSDRYRWSALPCAMQLFTKPLSKLGIREYQEILDGIGTTFEAVSQGEILRETPNESIQGKNFSQIIGNLERVNQSLQADISSRDQVEDLLSQEAAELRRKVKELERTNTKMKKQLACMNQTTRRYSRAASIYLQRVKLVEGALETIYGNIVKVRGPK